MTANLRSMTSFGVVAAVVLAAALGLGCGAGGYDPVVGADGGVDGETGGSGQGEAGADGQAGGAAGGGADTGGGTGGNGGSSGAGGPDAGGSGGSDAGGSGGSSGSGGSGGTGGSGGAGPGCGNGSLDIDQNEECDDGNTDNGDGCDANCQYEPVGSSCGDGSTDALEKCDDGNTNNGDGCNPTCNLTTTMTTLATGINGDALAVDGTYLWIAGCAGYNSSGPIDPCQIQRLDIDDCLQNGNCNPTPVLGGNCGAPVDAQGTSAVMGCVSTLTTDGYTLWFGDAHTVRAVDIQTMNVTTVAGDPALCAAVDGTGSSGLFHDIRGLTYYDGYVYLLDGCEEVLRRLDPTTGEVVTLAGQRIPASNIPQTGPNQYQCQSGWSCSDGTPTDGQGLNAVFGSPRYLTTDHTGNLYITDTNGEAIRTYDIASGQVGTLVGGAQAYVDGTGAAVRLDRPRGMTSDGTSLYWNEQNQHTVRQVIIQSASTSTLAAVRGCPGSADGTGADATQDWSGNCSDPALNGLPRIDTPMGGIAFHFPSRSIFLLEGGRLRRIE